MTTMRSRMAKFKYLIKKNKNKKKQTNKKTKILLPQG